MKTRLCVIFVGLLFGSLTLLNAENSTPAKPGDLRAAGKVDFPVTCAPAQRAEFVRGVALLHSFFYEEARRIFTAVAEQDPNCAMAQWGIAMTWWHPIWTPPTPDEMRAGQAAIGKAMSLKAGSDRERQFITALNAYYTTADGPATEAVGQSCHGPVGSLTRVVAYEKEMHKLALAYPDDFEAQTFYALAVLALGYASPTDTTLAHQLEAAAVLEKLWKKNPQHPGVTHYLIHCYDYPSLAQRGLAAAKAYGAIAPWVPHALHMPSHIFTRLGMWDESIAANLAAVDAARAYAAARGRSATEAEELHALDYLVYSYLQEARDDEAKKIVDFVATVHQTNPKLEFSAAYGLAAVPARYALERNAWTEAAALPVPKLPHWSTFPFMGALFEYAHALGRAHLGDLDGARTAVGRMAQSRDASRAPKFDYFRRHLDLQIRAASAWILYGEGRKEEAIDLLSRTADAEDLLGKHPVSPGALLPAREQLGEMLMQLDRPKEAQQAFASALKIYPGRLQGLFGAAQAAERSGDLQSASDYYAKLVAQTAQSDDSRPEVVQARAYRSAEHPAAHSDKAADSRD